jgi:thioredoxin
MKKITLMLLALVATLATSAQDIANAANTVNNNDATGKIIEIDAQQFNQLIVDTNNPEWVFKGQRPAVVDFNAAWCGPCRKMTPIIEQLAQEFSGKVDFYSINLDENKELAMGLGIRSIPFIIYCPMTGNPLATVGLQDYDTILAKINEILAEK